MTIGDCFDYIAEFAEMENPDKEKVRKANQKTLIHSKKGVKEWLEEKSKGLRLKLVGIRSRYKTL
ncbi:hypothetical protein ABNG30_29405 [Bacillus thuringiensis]